ncbi:Eco29kI family restriction endonuclease [Nocardiopsis changdeensis]|uniref:Eco29kI family restriction endonuclease n=1 Tax=Nocardiopsis changdeensis TaxID=2831969 RepID=A0ABX8BK83_9ACTN|nr:MULTISPECIES: Eco29kI family restriction endonuclease [Nocardiopsis]QUX22479.1 Eco29kI family restriction endonuclease [Nocardiopsis changdeensis]QYX38421.1 Eco29kI family restriction endonuclease [Nocardiopsis sp. MT53]
MTQQLKWDDEPSHRAEFRLSITKALKDQLAQSLAELEPSPLSMERLNELDKRGGIYQLYHNEHFVYVGKADKNLPQRIKIHLKKISGRKNISIDEMKFTCLYVDEDFPAVAPEKLLIAKYRERGEIPWNTNGFGNNDPGRQRDGTIIPANHFDVLHPINLELPVQGIGPGKLPLRKLLAEFKKQLPYNFRYALKLLGPMGDVETTIPRADPSAGEIFSIIGKAITQEWQISLLHGYAIMYPEGKKDYPSAWRYYRDGNPVDVDPQVDQAHEIAEEDSDEES